jgi:hypothetical protein
MPAFEIRPVMGSDCLEIMADGVRAAIIYPPEEDGRVAIYPWPRTYTSLTFEGLPEPLKPEWDWHPSLAAIREFLGIEQERAAA